MKRNNRNGRVTILLSVLTGTLLILVILLFLFFAKRDKGQDTEENTEHWESMESQSQESEETQTTEEFRIWARIWFLPEKTNGCSTKVPWMGILWQIFMAPMPFLWRK